MTKSERVAGILPLMNEHYGDHQTATLDYDPDEPWQLLFATILSAQCTDARVNIVTKDLYRRYPSVQAFAMADIHEMEDAIRSIGFYRAKARNLIACAQRLMEVYGGEVPRSIEDLTSLPGVGRKTANVIRGNVYHDPSIVVDTHVKRIANRWGLSTSDDPVQVEQDLMRCVPRESWIQINLQGIALGREICKAPTPRCEECFLTQYCKYYIKKKQ